jgi:hypothetical protein
MRTQSKWIVLAALTTLTSCTPLVTKELEEKPAPPDAGDEFCRGSSDGTDCSTAAAPDHVCVSFLCVPRGCGDGFVEGEEACDPPDGLSCCDGCRLCCEVDEDCDDGNPCNGEDVCTGDNVCVPAAGLIPADGTACEAYADDKVVDGFCCDAVCQEEPCS